MQPEVGDVLLPLPGALQLHGAVAVERRDDLYRQHALHDQLRRVQLSAGRGLPGRRRSRTRPASTRSPRTTRWPWHSPRPRINQDKGSLDLSQDLSKVYSYKDPRTYPISAYSYLIVPTETRGNFTTAKGATLGYFGAFSNWARTMGALGYSPLPMNLVLAGMDQLLKIPGLDAATKKTIQDTK